MKYKILIKRCEDPRRASAIAAEVSRWSGSTIDVVYSAITQKAICIRKEAEADEARGLCARFSAIGAEMEMVPLAGLTATATSTEHGDDCEDEGPGRILTDAEYAEMANARPDVFYLERSARFRNILAACLVAAVAVCFYMNTLELVEVATDFLVKLPEERVATLAKIDDELQKQLEKRKEKEEKKVVEAPTDKRTLKPTTQPSGGTGGGGGDYRARVTAQGVLGILTGDIKGKTVADADVFGKGGFASGIDAIISGVGGLKRGADGGAGRKGIVGIGHGPGVGSGFGGNGGIDGLMSSLMGPPGGSGLQLTQGTVGRLTVSTSGTEQGGVLSGGRSRLSIQRVVMQNMAALRHAYSRRLRDKPGLNGTVTVKFSIDEFGKVIFAQMTSSTINDSELEQTVVTRVKSWVFEKIDKPGDVTEVTYPFTFTQ